jgi:hypothetical protein
VSSKGNGVPLTVSECLFGHPGQCFKCEKEELETMGMHFCIPMAVPCVADTL